jgi:hypothetical protein
MEINLDVVGNAQTKGIEVEMQIGPLAFIKLYGILIH